MRDDIFPEFGADYSVTPIEIDVRHLEAKDSPVLIDIEYPFVEETCESLETRRETLHLGSEGLHQVDGIGTADGEEDNAPEGSAMVTEPVNHMVHAHPEGCSGSDYVSYNHHTILAGAYLLVTYVQSLDHVILDDPFA